MIERQLIPRGILSPKVLAAIRTVPRHLFVEDTFHESAYEDHPLPIGEGQTISQPYMVALMTELLDVMKDNKRAYKVYRSLGFSVEGIHRQAARLGSSFKDLMVMSVLRREYYSYRHRLEYAPPMAFPDGERPGELCIRCDQGR